MITIYFQSPFQRVDERVYFTDSCFRALRIYIRWWRRHGFDRHHARRMLIEIKRSGSDPQ
jgi:hypothetical protein